MTGIPYAYVVLESDRPTGRICPVCGTFCPAGAGDPDGLHAYQVHHRAQHQPPTTCDACRRPAYADVVDGGVYDHDGLRRFCKVHLGGARRAGMATRWLVLATGMVHDTTAGCPACGWDIDRLAGNPDCRTCAAEPAQAHIAALVAD